MKRFLLYQLSYRHIVVPPARLELARLSALGFESRVSTNSTTEGKRCQTKSVRRGLVGLEPTEFRFRAECFYQFSDNRCTSGLTYNRATKERYGDAFRRTNAFTNFATEYKLPVLGALRWGSNPQVFRRQFLDNRNLSVAMTGCGRRIRTSGVMKTSGYEPDTLLGYALPRARNLFEDDNTKI